MKAQILAALAALEARENVKVLYAVESGSRAWGFASPDSDWDVRFVYLRQPAWYLSVQQRRDVIESMLPGDIDLSGWDLRKALGLFAKSNPPLLEWLRSPIVYQEETGAAQSMRELAAQWHAPRSCMNHYLHMAEGNYREYLQGGSVRLKKYFYVLRPILACRWMEMHGEFPPIEFASLVSAVLPDPLQAPVSMLLAKKCAGDELAWGARIPQINDFLEAEIQRLHTVVDALPKPNPIPWQTLDQLFVGSLKDVWRFEI